MEYKLGDIFIGDFDVTQQFGAHPEIYFPRYQLKGHNGVDFGCPTMTPILSAADGWVSESGFDAGGYGNYIKVVHDGYFTLYGHLNDILVRFKDKVVAGQIIGHSNNTGFSTGPHLHFGVAPCDINGIKTESGNGYSGYINPLGDRCKWDVKGLKEPIVPTIEQMPDVPVPAKDFTEIVTKSTNWDIISAYFKLTDVEKITPNFGEEMIRKVADIEESRQQAVRELEDYKKNNASPTPPSPVVPSDGTIPSVPQRPAAPVNDEPSILFIGIADLLQRLANKFKKK